MYWIVEFFHYISIIPCLRIVCNEFNKITLCSTFFASYLNMLILFEATFSLLQNGKWWTEMVRLNTLGSHRSMAGFQFIGFKSDIEIRIPYSLNCSP